jgi:predicted AAA+ superfamily ATPase
MIARPQLLEELKASLTVNPVTALLGPRQCGKTTLARQINGDQGGTFFDLQDPQVAAAFEHPMFVLAPLAGLIVLDEAQLCPAIYPVLRVLVDEDRRSGSNRRFLLLGSASPTLIKGVAESLAGRVHLIPMQGFSLEEVGEGNLQTLWNRGGFPNAFLAGSDHQSFEWRRDFIETFLLRDLPQYGVRVPASELRRLWIMCSHLHGRLLNLSDLGRSLGRSQTAVAHHLDILEDAFMIRRLRPWHENIGKRQRRAPKIYLRDSGILHALLGIRESETLRTNPAVGASWEGFLLEQILTHLRPEEAWHWQTQSGAELDLLVFSQGKRIGFEIKLTDSPRTTKSMRIAMADLKLDHLFVVHSGSMRFMLDDHITALPAGEIPLVGGEELKVIC